MKLTRYFIALLVICPALTAQNITWQNVNPGHRLFNGFTVQPDGKILLSSDSMIYIGNTGAASFDSLRVPKIVSDNLYAAVLAFP
jgi:hypothetical protein